MNTATAKSSASCLKTRILCTAAVVALCGLSTPYASADSSTDPTVTRSDKVSLANIDISTPEGAHAARARLRETARRLCSQVSDSLDLSRHSNYVACVDATVDAALRKVNELLAAAAPGTPAQSDSHTAKRTQQVPATPEARLAKVSLADLDLTTAAGQEAARARLHQEARRLCSQLADSLDLSHQSNFVACVEASMAQALRPVETAAMAAEHTAGSMPPATR